MLVDTAVLTQADVALAINRLLQEAVLLLLVRALVQLSDFTLVFPIYYVFES